MRVLASFVTGRRTKWVVIVLWILAFAVMSYRVEPIHSGPPRTRETAKGCASRNATAISPFNNTFVAT